MVYLGVAVLFWITLLIELGKWLMQFYNFQNAAFVFGILTLIYLWKHKEIPQKIQKETHVVELQKAVTSKDNLNFFFYGSFAVYFWIFLYTYFIDVEKIFEQASIVMLGCYIVFKLLGGVIEIPKKENEFSQTSFLKVLVFSLSFYLICMSWVLNAFGVSDGRMLFLLIVSILYISAFTYLFSDIFERVYIYLGSDDFRRWLIQNTYMILAGVFILCGLVYIGIKSWAFETVLHKYKLAKSTVVVQTERIYTAQPIEDPKPTIKEITETKIVGEVYDLQTSLYLGLEWDDVRDLQEALEKLGMFRGAPTGEFDEYTKQVLIDTLVEKCNWSSSARGIFGPLAKACIDELEYLETRRIEILPSGKEKIMSDEVHLPKTQLMSNEAQF